MGWYDFIRDVELISLHFLKRVCLYMTYALSPFQHGALDAGPAGLAQSQEGEDSHMWHSSLGTKCCHTAGLEIPEKVYCIPSTWLPLQVKMRALTRVLSSFSHDWVYGLNWGYFFMWKAASKRCRNKRCYKQRKMQSSIFQCVLLWRWAAPGGWGRKDEGVLHQRGSDHFTYFLFKAYVVTSRRTPKYCPL